LAETDLALPGALWLDLEFGRLLDEDEFVFVAYSLYKKTMLLGWSYKSNDSHLFWSSSASWPVEGRCSKSIFCTFLVPTNAAEFGPPLISFTISITSSSSSHPKKIRLFVAIYCKCCFTYRHISVALAVTPRHRPPGCDSLMIRCELNAEIPVCPMW
jgi:hypothetical protein